MTYGETLGASLLRSLIIAVIGTPAAWALARRLETFPAERRGIHWIGVLLPFCTPSLVTGYCYRDTSLAMVHLPVAREAIYSLIVLAQLVPLGVLLIRFAPAPRVSDSAWHVHRMSSRVRSLDHLRLRLQSRAEASVYAFSALFVFSFQEAELASLLQATTWTEWLFTRHAQGLDPWTSARLAMVPVLIQVPLILVLLQWISGDREIEERLRRSATAGTPLKLSCLVWVACSMLVVCLLPAIQLWRGARQGLPALLHQPSTWRELQDSLLLAITVAGLCFGLVAILTRVKDRTMRTVVSAVSSLGLMGNLSLGLILAVIFQTPWLLGAYDTPIPLIVGEVLYLFPRMLILMHGVSRFSESSSRFLIHLWGRLRCRGRSIPIRELRWRESTGLLFGIFLLGCGWVYLEVMLPSLLAMPGMVPVGLTLYNSLHYGRISALGAKLVLALLVPVAAMMPLFLIRRT